MSEDTCSYPQLSLLVGQNDLSSSSSSEINSLLRCKSLLKISPFQVMEILLGPKNSILLALLLIYSTYRYIIYNIY